jgi:hypothetical protein
MKSRVICLLQVILFIERIKVSEIEMACDMNGRNDKYRIYVWSTKGERLFMRLKGRWRDFINLLMPSGYFICHWV